ncbi:MAG: alpha/beta hydrolase [Acidobacteriota bacterium]
MRVIYLHGFASSPSSRKATFFAGRLRRAGAACDVPALDGGDFSGLTITGQLAVVDALAAGEPVSLIGSSLGGYLAALYAATHANVERVVLLAPAFGFARRWPRRLGEAAVARWRAEGSMPVFHYAAGEERRVGIGLLDDGARYPDFPDVRQPALLFHGRRDEVVPYTYSEEFQALHPAARLHLLESGHELTDVLETIWPVTAEFLGLANHG